MRRVLIPIVLAAVALSACGSPELSSPDSAAPPTVPNSGTRVGTAPEGTAGTLVEDEEVDEVEAAAGKTPRSYPTWPKQTRPSTTQPPPPPTQPPVTSAPPPTYDPALAPWCNTLSPIMNLVQSISDSDVSGFKAAVQPIRDSIPLAPPDMVEPSTRLLEVLELLEGAIDRGEVTNKDSMIRWGLVNLSPEQITSLQVDLYTFTDRIGVSCPKP